MPDAPSALASILDNIKGAGKPPLVPGLASSKMMQI
jgi:hypothetical protein